MALLSAVAMTTTDSCSLCNSVKKSKITDEEEGR